MHVLGGRADVEGRRIAGRGEGRDALPDDPGETGGVDDERRADPPIRELHGAHAIALALHVDEPVPLEARPRPLGALLQPSDEQAHVHVVGAGRLDAHPRTAPRDGHDRGMLPFAAPALGRARPAQARLLEAPGRDGVEPARAGLPRRAPVDGEHIEAGLREKRGRGRPRAPRTHDQDVDVSHAEPCSERPSLRPLHDRDG